VLSLISIQTITLSIETAAAVCFLSNGRLAEENLIEFYIEMFH